MVFLSVLSRKQTQPLVDEDCEPDDVTLKIDISANRIFENTVYFYDTEIGEASVDWVDDLSVKVWLPIETLFLIRSNKRKQDLVGKCQTETLKAVTHLDELWYYFKNIKEWLYEYFNNRSTTTNTNLQLLRSFCY